MFCRRYSYATCLEGALKIKELTYLHRCAITLYMLTSRQSHYKSSHPDNRQIEIWKWGHPGWRAEARPSGVGRPRPCHDHGDHQGPRLLKVHERSSTGWRKIIQWLGCDFLISTTRWQHEVVVRCSSVRKETSRPSDSTPTIVSPSPILSTAFRLVAYWHWFWQIVPLQH